ncbi:alpha/beta fold hydrolase [Streptomyces sp. A3M-1-3]|uniref:alpha/beta fold hydrolase n=1 Tax=Streptomyces sp. A3M-1-3 TaxID=2962044 RepID=UPI0020B80E54|nr:alpha/beta fold hydrolase [Streptomyces sp. A3M-1-3]MCP3821638.1 alpha/beta fold hydrolase [Streptomyces sp. A3M-1-3]
MFSENGCDVLIVGAGPTGITAACELLRRGVKVRLIDAAPRASVHSKAMLVWPRTLDILEDLGLSGVVDGTAVKLRQMNYYSEKRPVTRIRMTDDLAPYCLPQRLTEEILTTGLKGLGGTIEREVSLLALHGVDFSGAITPGRHVGATLEHADGSIERINVPWVIGADGATSVVRNQLGIAYEGATYENRFLIADARVQDNPLDPDEVHYYQSRIGVLAIVPQPYGLYRFFTNAPAELSDGTLEDMQHLVDLRGPGGLKLIEPDWVTTFRVHRRRAASFQLSRVFLAGDAAHAHSPMGGQGLNTGIQDAQNLAWKLASVIRGDSRTALLASYTPERAAVADAVVRDTDLQTRAAMWSRSSQVALRDVTMRALDRTRALDRFYLPIAAGRRWVYEAPQDEPARSRRGGSRANWCSVRSSLRRHAREGAALPRQLAVELGVAGPSADPGRYSLVVLADAKGPGAGLDGAVRHLTGPWRGQVRVVDATTSGSRRRGVDLARRAARELHCGRAGFHLVRPDGHIVLHGHREDLGELHRTLGRLLIARDEPVSDSRPDSLVEETMSAPSQYVPPAHIVGEGRHKVIVLHSLFGGHDSFGSLWPYLDGTRYSYAFMDARGFGDAIDTTGTYSTDEIASDVLSLADHLGWQEFSLIGHSLGGQPIQQVLLKAPHRVRKLIGLSPVPANGMPIPDSDFPLFAEAAHKVENRRIIIDLTTGNRLSANWVDSWAETSMRAVGPVAFRGYLDSFRTTDFSERITGAEVPALAVVGENDPAVTADAMNETWMKHYPNAELAVIGNAGHYPMVETPVALATLLENFLAK